MIDEVRFRELLALTPAQLGQLNQYVDLLMTASAAFNLTAIRDRDGVESNLVGGSLEIARLLPDDVSSLIDVGTGGGIPGMVIAIARPEIQVCLLDATTKKVRFLEETASELGLTNVTALQGRAEELGQDPAHREQYDAGTARAVARLASLVELVLPFVRTGGSAIFPKGTGVPEELDEARPAIGFVGGASPQLVHSALDDTRYIIMEKRTPTPERFPRRNGIPGKRPLGIPAS